MNKDLKKRLIVKRQNVKNKLKILKQGEIMQEDRFNPITRYLKNIEHKLDTSRTPKNSTTNRNIKQEINGKQENDEEQYFASDSSDSIDDTSDMKKSILEDVNIDNDDQDNVKEAVDDDSSRFKDIFMNSYSDYLEQYDPLPRKYINGMYLDENNIEYDHKYGIRLDTTTEKLMIGDSPVYLEGSDIIIKNKRYKGTQGLYELLFKKHPIHFTEQDKDNYKKIVHKTNAHRRYYKADKQVDGSRLEKYKKIIAPISEGKGMFMEVTNKDVDYVHWDDPNELVDRLRLLVASQAAGHTGHTNEIISIIEELKEANIIA